MTTVQIRMTNDGGQLVAGTNELETAVILSLFGGNADDTGLQGDSLSWWGNVGELNEARVQRSETQNLLRGLPSTTANLLRVRDAILRDLAWMDAPIEVTLSIVAPKRIKIVLDIDAQQFTFLEDFGSDSTTNN